MILPLILAGCTLVPSAAPATQAAQQPPRIVLVDDDAELEEALAARAPRREFPVRAIAVTLPGEDAATVRVLLAVWIDDPQDGTALASVAYSLAGERGSRQAHALRRIELRRGRPGGPSFVEVSVVPPGQYRLRIAALRNNRVGTAEASVQARVHAAGPLRVGDPLIGDTPGQDIGAGLSPDRRARGGALVVSIPLAADREFPPAVTVAVEASKGESGAAVLSVPARILPGDGRTRVAQALLEAAVLPPGDYVARAIVSVDGREAARVRAPFSVEGAPATAVPPTAAAFRPEEVLDAAVLGPFLDDLAARSPERTRPAIARAKAGEFAGAAEAAAAGAAEANDPARPFLKGLALFSQKQLQDASESFRDTLRAAPDYFVAAFYIGACYAAGGRDPQAINAWQTSLVGLESFPIVYRLLGDAMTRTGQAGRAMDTLDEAASKWPGDRDIRLRLARAAIGGRNYGRVVALADASLSQGPPDPELLFVAMQAIFEQASRDGGPRVDDALARMTRYRDAYVAGGGSRQALVDEWVAAVGKKQPSGSK